MASSIKLCAGEQYLGGGESPPLNSRPLLPSYLPDVPELHHLCMFLWLRSDFLPIAVTPFCLSELWAPGLDCTPLIECWHICPSCPQEPRNRHRDSELPWRSCGQPTTPGSGLLDITQLFVSKNNDVCSVLKYFKFTVLLKWTYLICTCFCTKYIKLTLWGEQVCRSFVQK